MEPFHIIKPQTHDKPRKRKNGRILATIFAFAGFVSGLNCLSDQTAFCVGIGMKAP